MKKLLLQLLSLVSMLAVAVSTSYASVTLDTSGEPALIPVASGFTTSPGTRVRDFIETAGNKLVVSGAGTSKGIAVTAVDNANGAWQYSTNGTVWTALGSPSVGTARLLSADADSRVRFVPSVGFAGVVTFSYKGWDGTGGTEGNTADVSSGANFSANTEAASLRVGAVYNPASVASAATPFATNTLYDVSVFQLTNGNIVSLGRPDRTAAASPYRLTIRKPDFTLVLDADTTTFGGYRTAVVAAPLAGGGFVAVWADGSSTSTAGLNLDGTNDIGARFRIYDNNGSVVGSDTRALTTITTGAQFTCRVCPLANGGFAATWIDQSISPQCIRLRRFDAEGNALDPVEVNVGAQGNDAVTSISVRTGGLGTLTNGNLAYAWSSANSSARQGYLTIIDPDGNYLDKPGGAAGDKHILVSSIHASGANYGRVAGLSNGGLMNTFTDQSDDPPTTSSAFRSQALRVWSAALAPVTTTTLELTGVDGYYFQSSQSSNPYPIAGLIGGGFVIPRFNVVAGEIQYGIFDNAGTGPAVASFTTVASATEYNNGTPAGTFALQSGGFGLHWADSSGNLVVKSFPAATAAASLATVTTATQSGVTSSSATLGGEVTSDGGATVTDRGIVWGTSPAPTTADNKVANGSGTGAFSATVTSLPASTLIYVRAYAINSEGPSYGTQISFTTSAPVASNAVVSGSFTGDGLDNKLINLGFQPDVVIIKDGRDFASGADAAQIRTKDMTVTSEYGRSSSNTSGSDRIKSLTANGFTLGTSTTVNTSGRTYYYFAFSAKVGEIVVNKYTGTGTSGNTISGLGFQPALVFAFGINRQGAFRTSSMPGDMTGTWEANVFTDGITSLTSDGFVLGTNAQVNNAAEEYYYFACKEVTGKFKASSYIANSIDNRQITGFGFQPEGFFVKRQGSTVGQMKFVSTGVDTEVSLATGTAGHSTDRIQKILTDGVEVGAGSSVNSTFTSGVNTTTYHYFAFAGVPAGGSAATTPTVTTPTSASVTHNSATLGGNVTADGGASITERGVVYALTSANANPEIAGSGVTNVPGTGTTGVFTVSATSLAASSGYSFKAYATNSEGTTYSSVGTFTTLAPPAVAPTVTTPTSASVTITTAVLGGNVTGDGGAAITARGVVYAPTATNANPEIGGTGVVNEAGTGTTGVFTVNVSALTSSTGYSFKAYATNSVGTSYSSVGTFTTLATPAEIAVTGKGNNIADGSTSPSTANDTDFGSVPVQGVTLEKTYTINNLGETALTVGTASASGDFTITQQPTSPVAGGGSTTLKVSFNPSAEGLRTASVSFTNSDSDESPFNFDIQGTGTGPQTFDLATNPLANTPYDDGETYILTIAAVPTVVSPTKTGVGNTSATLGGNVTVDGGAITERGVLVSSSDNTPTIEEVGSGVTKFTTTGTTGVFTVSASALTSGTTYYYVAYATNGLGTGYTSVDSFTTTTGPVLPEPVPTSLGDVVSFGDAPGEDGSASVGEFGKLLRGGFIAENGFLVFPGTLELGTGSPAVTADTDSGLWKVGAGNLFLLARSGTTVPDVAGAQFDTLPEVPGINDAGEVSFLGTLIIGTGGVTIDNDTGMWSEIGGTGLSLLMREDDDVPGFAGAKVSKFASGLYATAHTGATTGEAAFSVYYKGASTKTALLRASVSGATTTITEIAREGEAAPGTTANFTNLAGSYVDPGRMDAQGNFAFAALTTPGSKDGIWYQPVGGSVSNVVFRGDVAPGTTGATFSKIYRPSMGSNGVIAFRAAVANNTGDNTGNIRNDGIWRVDSANPAGMTCILRRGDDSSVVSNLPGVSRVGNVWGGWLANSNRGAWKAWLDVNGNFTSATNDGDVHAIYTDLSGSMQLGVAVGDAAPGTTGATFSGFDLPVVGGNDQYAFLGTLAGGDTTADNNQGVWKSAASGGALTLVIRKGDVINTTEGNKTVEKMDFPGSNQNDRRWEQPVMDSTGLTVINITFTDGSTSQIQAP